VLDAADTRLADEGEGRSRRPCPCAPALSEYRRAGAPAWSCGAAEWRRRREDLPRRTGLRTRERSAARPEARAGQVETAVAALKVADQQLAASEATVSRTTVATHPDVKQAAAKLRESYLAAQRASVLAPVTGYVAKRSVQLGQQVAPGAPLLAIVPLIDVWVDANFKESHCRDVRIGQPVTLSADLYGGATLYHGSVIGLAPGTGSAFALLPPQNATGNWIKIVQRLPGRIRLDPQELAAHPLRVGLSMSVSIDTHDRSGPVLARVPSVERPLETKAYEHALADAALLEREIVQATSGLAAPRPSSPGHRHAGLSPRQRAALTVALSLAVFMNVLDLAIANVAIPQLAGELGTSADQGTW